MEANIWNLSKYARYENGSWSQIESTPKSTLIIKIENSRLLVVHDSTLIESFSLLKGSSDIRILTKDNIVVFVLKIQKLTRRFRVQFASNNLQTSEIATETFLSSINPYVKIENRTLNKQDTMKENITLSEAFENYFIKNNRQGNHQLPKLDPLPEVFPLESMVRECILDPGFLEICNRVNSCIENLK